MAKKKEKSKSYTVTNGCNVGESRYEVGDSYDPANHSKEDTQALIEMGCLEEDNGGN